MVRHTYGLRDGHVNPDGSFVHSGPKASEGYTYVAPDGTSHGCHQRYADDGSSIGVIWYHVLWAPVDATQTSTLTIVDHVNRRYSRQSTHYTVTGDGSSPPWPGLELESSPAEVREALRTGAATQLGTTTVDDTAAVAIAIPVPGARNLHRTLYVDLASYHPLRTVTTADGNPLPYVANRLPATPDTIALAKVDDPVPAGYTKVDQTDLVD